MEKCRRISLEKTFKVLVALSGNCFVLNLQKELLPKRSSKIPGSRTIVHEANLRLSEHQVIFDQVRPCSQGRLPRFSVLHTQREIHPPAKTGATLRRAISRICYHARTIAAADFASSICFCGRKSRHTWARSRADWLFPPPLSSVPCWNVLKSWWKRLDNDCHMSVLRQASICNYHCIVVHIVNKCSWSTNSQL